MLIAFTSSAIRSNSSSKLFRSSELLIGSSSSRSSNHMSEEHGPSSGLRKHSIEHKLISAILQYLDLLLRYPTSRAYAAAMDEFVVSLAWLLIVYLSPSSATAIAAANSIDVSDICVRIYRYLYAMNPSFVRKLMRCILNAAEEMTNRAHQSSSKRTTVAASLAWLQLSAHPAILSCTSASEIDPDIVLKRYINDVPLLEVLKTFLKMSAADLSAADPHAGPIAERVAKIVKAEDSITINASWVKALKQRSFG
jgi:hypothetical protein